MPPARKEFAHKRALVVGSRLAWVCMEGELAEGAEVCHKMNMELF